MLQMSVPWWELVVRSVVVYSFLFIALRLTGRRQVGQLSSFDFILLLILSNAVQNSMNAGDNSLIGGLVSAVTLVTFNYLIGYLSFRSRKVERLVDGKPEVLIHNGNLFERTMRKEQITHAELDAVLRKNGIRRVSEVQFAVLEPNGTISVICKMDDQKAAVSDQKKSETDEL